MDSPQHSPILYDHIDLDLVEYIFEKEGLPPNSPHQNQNPSCNEVSFLSYIWCYDRNHNKNPILKLNCYSRLDF